MPFFKLNNFKVHFVAGFFVIFGRINAKTNIVGGIKIAILYFVCALKNVIKLLKTY